MSQHMDALATGQALRLDRAQLRRDIAAGTTSWQDMILHPPACLGDMLLSEVLLMMVPGIRRTTVETMGRHAFHAGITLTVRVRRASTRTRGWAVAEAALFVGQANRGRGASPRGPSKRASRVA